MNALDLAGDWRLFGDMPGNERKIDCAIAIPGDTASALMGAGLLDDPYWGFNEIRARWIEETRWVLTRNFWVSEDFLDHPRHILSITRLDTVAKIMINGHCVAHGDNMFVGIHACLERGVLKAGENHIEVLFVPTRDYTLGEAKKLPYPVPCVSFPEQSPHRNLMRKAQCHGGWDWGPRLMVNGIYGSCLISAEGSVSLREASVSVSSDDMTVWNIEIALQIYSEEARDLRLDLRLAKLMPSANLSLEPSVLEGSSEDTCMTIAVLEGENSIDVAWKTDNKELWYPNGMGDQNLYRLAISLGGRTIVRDIGFRSIEIVFEDDQRGRSFFARVNGRDIFCKGTNWIPVDARPSLHTESTYVQLLSDAAGANMNMARMWGGGQYEIDLFYSLCDRLGLMVWQDFMFSCSLYPASDEFLRNVSREASYQIKRLRHHACIALWCGNNENLGALNWFDVSKKHRDRYLLDYDRLNEATLGKITAKLDPRRLFWPSSPSGGPGDYSDNWHNDSRGDMHYWSVWHEGAAFESYYKITPRFCSEFGFQSFPSLDGIKCYTPESQLNITSPIMEHHQRSENGNKTIIETMARYFRFPNGLRNQLYISQTQQAWAIQTAIEYWRSQRPICMGALYWQLNDLWPCPSWSSIEYGGKWKMLHYAARRFFAPLLIAAHRNISSPDLIDIYLCSDLASTITGTVSARLMRFDGSIYWQRQFNAACESDESRRVASIDLAAERCDASQCYLSVDFRGIDGAGKEIIATNWRFLDAPKRCDLMEPELEIEIVKSDRYRCDVRLSSRYPLFWAMLDTDGLAGRFSDNFLLLSPNQPVNVVFTAQESVSDLVAALRSSLHIYHLYASYQYDR